ncbi:MAG: hypothetical protein ACOYD6_03960 [Limnochordia bacterium]
MGEKEKAWKEFIAQGAIMPLDLEDGAQLPHIMGWSMYDYQLGRARAMEEIAEELGADYHRPKK